MTSGIKLVSGDAVPLAAGSVVQLWATAAEVQRKAGGDAAEAVHLSYAVDRTLASPNAQVSTSRRVSGTHNRELKIAA